MRCLRCKHDNDRVVDSRTSTDGTVIRRRRECLDCFLRYTTYERIEDTPLRVIKKSGERVRFDRERVLQGMLLACEKLPVSAEQLEEASARPLPRISPRPSPRPSPRLSRIGLSSSRNWLTSLNSR